MKAIILDKDSFGCKQTETPSISGNQALVKIHYAALNHRDEWIRIGQYAKIQLPAILGSDGCGEVVQVGDAVNNKWLNKTVIINPNIGWGKHPIAQDKNYQILGMPTFGTLAEYIAIDIDRLVEKPNYLSNEQAAAIPLSGLTAYNALVNKGGAKANHKVLISGVGGGVAQFAFLFAVALKCETYVTSSKKEVIEECMKLGAKGGANYIDKDAIKILSTQVGGFDIVIDSAGGDGMNTLLAALAPSGKYVFYGATKGLPSALNLRMVFWNHLQIMGTTMGSDNDFEEMIAFCIANKIAPIIDKVFNIDNAVDAFDRMAEGAQFGKILIKVIP
jgi:zinc-binding alcohol dehydrogenase/oxidoreductase